MKLYNVCFWIYMVCAVFYLGFSTSKALAQEAPAAQTDPAPAAQTEPAAQTDPAPAVQSDDGQNVPAEALAGQPMILKCEKNGVCVWAPVSVEVNVPEQPAPEVNVENSIKFPREMKVKRTDRTWCERHPVGCTFLIVGVVGAVAGGGFYLADELGAFDTTNTVSYR